MTQNDTGLQVTDFVETGTPGSAGGVVEVEVIRDGPDGPQVLQRRVSHNTVLIVGKKRIFRIGSGIITTHHFDQFRIGTSGAAATGSQTNVLSPVTGTIDTADSKSMLSGTRTMQWVISYASGGSSKSATGIAECALLDQNTTAGGCGWMRATFTAVNKTKNDKLKITYKARIT